MWRSMAARSTQLVARGFRASQMNQVLSETRKPFNSFPKTSLSPFHRFFSHSSANPSDDSLGLAENGDPELDFIAGIETNAAQVPSFEGLTGDETRMDSFVPGDSKNDMEEETQDYELDANKLENVLSLLQSKVDGSLESSLNAMALDLREDFVVKVLRTPYILGENLLRFFKWVTNKPGLKVTTSVVESLVKVICSDIKMKNAYDLWDLVKEIGEKDNEVLTVDVLNELVALFSKLGKGKAAVEVFDKFSDFGCTPNEETYYFTIEALCRRSFYDWAWSVCEKMLDARSLPDDERLGKIISWLCKGDKAKEAHAVYLSAEGKNKNLPQSSVNFLISSLCKKDETVKLALEMLDGFSGDARKYAIKPFSTVVRSLCRTKDVDEAKKVLLKMIEQGPPPGNAVFNSVVGGYSKVGDMEKAKEVMKLMEDRGLKPDVYAYTVVMSGYSNGGQMDQACEVLSEAKKKHTKLTPVTYHTLIRGYCKLEQFDKALKMLAEMKDFGVEPNVDEYNKLIQSLCLKVLDWQTAEKLLNEMKENSLYLNGITRSLITAVKELEAEGMKSLEATTEV
ncbi:Pentatricopeptide repeat-containing protein [Hibiscus syriacus]|uniref:Pentatricopeptide repeat-containing protein n=1 Tax=Hibiscus syriacus TaxID=106335 RepID=A0A6A3B0K4_HIBSY|nr:pentatricopeptide repeat-containing protein At3g02650, mitochondrial-like [Hibiscus syriacus]KAE8710604.1 Pentatricopeptide repeat-containing protein [Hibiscus syriacus]